MTEFKKCNKCNLDNALFCDGAAEEHPGECCDCMDEGYGLPSKDRSVLKVDTSPLGVLNRQYSTKLQEKLFAKRHRELTKENNG